MSSISFFFVCSSSVYPLFFVHLNFSLWNHLKSSQFNFLLYFVACLCIQKSDVIFLVNVYFLFQLILFYIRSISSPGHYLLRGVDKYYPCSQLNRIWHRVYVSNHWQMLVIRENWSAYFVLFQRTTLNVCNSLN